jgi:uncharacterized protein (TIGR02646 family)
VRPVVRGPAPADDHGNPKTFANHGEAKQDLIDRLGEYCSYCETWIPVSLAIEHVRPKSLHTATALAWDNFLLACANCNSVKGDTDVALTDYYWPDSDNTARAFEYQEGGTVAVNSELTDAERARAQRTLSLTGLDRDPGAPNKPTPGDRRWLHRAAAWGLARRWLTRFEKSETDTETVVDLVVAQGRGHWSIWMTVFREHQDVRQRLIDALPGTAVDCFDEQCTPVPRPGGAL